MKLTFAPQEDAAAGGPIGVLCFSGDLPTSVAGFARERGHDVFIIAFRGFASRAVEGFPHTWVKLGQLGRLFRVMRGRSIRRIVIVGALTRPHLRDLSLDWKGLRDIPSILRTLRAGGDDSVLRSAVRYFEDHGLQVMAVSDVAPELLAAEGQLGAIAPDAKELSNLRIGMGVLDALSSFDAGQACVVLDGRPVAIEGAEGTDGMIVRVSELRANGRLRVSGPRGVLVKAAKRGQDLRVDLPTIGPRTIELAAKAQLAGVAIEAGKSLIAEREACLALADRLGLFVLGVARG
ncbi:MAG: UDP-2,3-diacylglucosamine diphosphatase LpxI [Beijerinckiaceae bacterium]